ncbi:hypothetical protein D9M68_969470 [compost metagenome]
MPDRVALSRLVSGEVAVDAGEHLRPIERPQLPHLLDEDTQTAFVIAGGDKRTVNDGSFKIPHYAEGNFLRHFRRQVTQLGMLRGGGRVHVARQKLLEQLPANVGACH